MDALRLLVSNTPLIFKTIFLHLIGLGTNSSKWSLKEAVTINVLRNIVADPKPPSITEQQTKSTRDREVKGNLWVSRVKFPAPPEDDARHLLFDAFRGLRHDGEEFTAPELVPVEAEWTGYRANVSSKEPEPEISEGTKFNRLMEETASDVTILYFHGGSYYLMDPATSRSIVAQHAQGISGRVLSVRYRLAPQNPFPAALLDGLMAYLSLLHPPPGSYHEPVPASKIVIAGDSAGGNLSLALLQTLLQARREAGSSEPKIRFHGAEINVPLPAGVIAGSPSLDLTHTLRTSEYHASCDYLAPKGVVRGTPRPCPAWPANPPRGHIFCENSALSHPLVSPLAATSWDASPPVLVVIGEEMAAEESKIWARKAMGDGAKVVLEQYEVMPHCFWHLFPGSPATKRCFEGWARFVTAVAGEVEGYVLGEPTFVLAKTGQARAMDLPPLAEHEHEAIVREMRRARWNVGSQK